MPGSGITLPLDLANIAARCKGSFYAPRRFAAVQLAYSNPRCRVLIFHTGRLVGTGMLYCPLICLYTPPLPPVSLSDLYSMCVCVLPQERAGRWRPGSP